MLFLHALGKGLPGRQIDFITTQQRLRDRADIGNQAVKQVQRHRFADYDAQIRRWIPHYEEMLATVVAVLDATLPAEPLVVDLGAGTGALTRGIRSLAPILVERVLVLGIGQEERRRLILAEILAGGSPERIRPGAGSPAAASDVFVITFEVGILRSES